ncbi:hypothetical protein GCM10017786_03010 [Amycolatopsis deserti]|uniref:Sortase n=1 Tax=Amycolatopsis deserti TaxID=185696 RepID=A0ABQ3IGD3_9PSEU|nr:choice-of-anchor P family protein [Amycolatopsis deserti]GHE77110.1 hypothetical protein GCM10017786_03010 [Amycolatopsis deserti]
MRRARLGLAAAMAAGVVLLSAIPASAAPGDGSAYGADVDVSLLGQPAVQVGPLAAASTEGPATSTLVGIDVPGIASSGTVQTSAERDETTGAVDSKATVEDLSVGVLGALGTIKADAVTAECHATQDGNAGSATLAGLNLGVLGTVGANPAANTVVNVGALGVNVASITFNEQISNPDGSLTVNAIHVRLLGGVIGSLGSGDVVVSSATCGPAGLPVPLASGAGMWIGLGLLTAIGVPAGVWFSRRRADAHAV